MLALFFTVMLLFTLFSEELYYLTLPKVVTEQAVRKQFPAEVMGPDGKMHKTKRVGLAIPQEALRGDSVYVLSQKEDEFFLVQCAVETGEAADGWIEVTAGLYPRAEVVVGSDREISEGKKVLKSGWNNGTKLHTAREQGEDMEKYTAVMERCLQRNVLYALGAVVAIIGLAVLCKLVFKQRYCWLKAPVLIIFCVLLCFFLQKNIVIPGEWIPEKLIDVNGWKENIGKYPLECLGCKQQGKTTVMPTATPFPSEMPERKVVKANPEAERISIDKTYFSDEGFREFIKEKIDTDGDGFLSKAEREQILRLEDPGYYKVGKVVLDGLDWFPNMEHLELMGEAEVSLDHHPSLVSVNWNESGQSAIFVDGCENLEQIDIFMSSNGGVYVNNCRNLKRLSSSDGSLGSLYASGVPKLRICVDWYEEIPKKIRLDGDAQIVWRLWDDPEEELRLDNIGVQFKVLEEGVLYWGELFSLRYELQVNWLGVNTSELKLDEQAARMYTMYNTFIPAEELADDSIRTLTKTILFSPKKASVYMVGSWNESNELLSARYYIVGSDGIITEYVSLEDMLEVAEQIEGLEGMKKLFLPGKE